jgi:branched-chain amino acid transport system substrate-binding protein
MRRRGHPFTLAAALATALVAASALAATAGGQPEGSAAARQIVIGWAYDGQGAMAPFDGPALAAARIRLADVNRRGGVNGRRLRLITCNTQGNEPTRAKACARQLLGRGAQVIFTTCDVDYATPVVQESINRGKLTLAPCIGTDQMGPKRFGRVKGRLAFSFGNVAQDEGSAMAEFAWRRGWRRAALATDTVIVYFRNVVQAFEARWRQLGGRIVAEETYQSAPGGGSPNIQNAISRLSRANAQVIVTSTAGAFGALPGLVSGLRSLRVNTPILNSWAGDGNYWLPTNPRVTNYCYVTYASAFGNDPNPAVRRLVNQMRAAGAPPGTGGFLTGPAMIDGLVTAIRRAKGSTRGVTLAAQLERFRGVNTISGKVSFSPRLHSVFGRTYRVMQIQNNQVRYVGAVRAKVVPRIG